jgi:hypothetical protein
MLEAVHHLNGVGNESDLAVANVSVKPVASFCDSAADVETAVSLLQQGCNRYTLQL